MFLLVKAIENGFTIKIISQLKAIGNDFTVKIQFTRNHFLKIHWIFYR